MSGQRYGTLWSEVDRIRAAGRVPVLELETDGAKNVKEDEVAHTITVFVDAPTFGELERRLRERATESAGEIGERLALARRQRDQAGDFDYVVVNDDLGRATAEVATIVDRELQAAGTMSP